MKDYLFSDFDIGLRRHNGTGDIYKIKDVDSILNSIRNILQYNIYEKKFKPMFGSNINSMLFELNTVGVDHDIKLLVENSINNYEPRVELLNVEVDAYDNTFNINLTFKVIGMDNIYNETIFLYKAR